MPRPLLLILAAIGLSASPIPIRHIRQLPFQCLLAATAQIAAALDYSELSQTYRYHPASWSLDWAADNLPPAYSRLWQQMSTSPGDIVTDTPTGSGIIVFSRPTGSTHAVSYVMGIIYDPKQPNTAYYNLTSYLSSTSYDNEQPVRAYSAPPH